MFRHPSFRVILIALSILGLAGLGFLFAPGGPTFAEARLELGGALVSGVVLSGAFLVAERRLEAEDRKHEERTAERQTRAQYQLALGMAETLEGRVLSGLDLSKLQLPGRNLVGAGLVKTNLSKANLAGADLFGANLYRANLAGADLTWAKLGEANLNGADLAGAKLRGVDLSGLHLYGVNLGGVDPTNLPLLSKMILYGENLLGGAALTGAKWDPENPPTWPPGYDPPENAWNPDQDG